MTRTVYRRRHDEIPGEDGGGDGRREGHRRRDGEAARGGGRDGGRRGLRRRGGAAHGGSVDVLVTCAGIIRDNLLFKMSDDDWDAVVDTHLKGTFYAVRAAQKHMVEQRSGKIVLISSTSALGNRGQTNYSAAKAGLQGMTKTLAIELGPYNVNVNCVAPGFIATDMTRQTADRIGVPFEQFMEHVAQEVPLRRVGQPEDVASTIAFLCSEDAGYVSGQVVYVAGGPRT
jgi:3-oxoacyl-[acyl-carrier protein] reductase